MAPLFDHLRSRAKADARRGKQPGNYEGHLRAPGGGRCVRHAPELGEVQGNPHAKGLEPLGELVKRMEKDGIQEDMTTQL